MDGSRSGLEEVAAGEFWQVSRLELDRVGPGVELCCRVDGRLSDCLPAGLQLGPGPATMLDGETAQLTVNLTFPLQLNLTFTTTSNCKYGSCQ